MAYATRADVYRLGLTAAAFVTRPRPYDAVTIASASIRLTAHGLAADDLVSLVAVSGGSLPTSVTATSVYSPVIVSGDVFTLKTYPAGVAISSWASGGSGWGVSVDYGPRLDAHLSDASAVIDEHLTAHEPPIPVDPVTGLYPPVLVGLCARMAARSAVTSLQIENAAYRVATDRLFARERQDLEILAAWKAGKPIQPRPTDQSDVADNGARASSSRDTIGWTTGYLF